MLPAVYSQPHRRWIQLAYVHDRNDGAPMLIVLRVMSLFCCLIVLVCVCVCQSGGQVSSSVSFLARVKSTWFLDLEIFLS